MAGAFRIRPRTGRGPSSASRRTTAGSSRTTSPGQRGATRLKTGFEFRITASPSAAGEPARPPETSRSIASGQEVRRHGNNLVATGDPFASFLLGQFMTPSEHSLFPTFRETYTGLWVNDEFKVNNDLTMTFGLRWDYESARTETTDQYSTFSPTAPNPGAGGIPGAMIFAGAGAGRTGSGSSRTSQGCPGSPSGLCLQAQREAGGAGRIRHLLRARRVRSGRSTHAGLRSAPFAPNVTNGLAPAFHLDQDSRRIGSSSRRSSTRPSTLVDPRSAWCRMADAATVPELVYDVSAPGHRQHDAQPLVHRQSWQPAEPPRLDAGR